MTILPEKKASGVNDTPKDHEFPAEMNAALEKMVANLQTPEARAGLIAAINASPKELGEAARSEALRKRADKI
jgi:hypothetical protein